MLSPLLLSLALVALPTVLPHHGPAVPAVSRVSAGAVRWDAVGHRVIAAIAYDHLRPTTRGRVDALLRQHPDLDSLSLGVDITTAGGVRELFLRASVWPDVIRRDPRFYNETDPAGVPTPLLAGYPYMARRAGWHYLSRSFSTDGTPTELLEAPNAVTMMPMLADELADAAVPASVRAYDLSWILHIVGDLHQPLHGTSRASEAHPNGDAGGNAEWVQLDGVDRDSINLHAVWDGLLGRATRDVPQDDVARELAAGLPVAAPNADLRIPDGAALADAVGAWADESAVLARYVTYDLPTRLAGGAPPRLPASYVALAESIARQRITLAGYRLAALLDARLCRDGTPECPAGRTPDGLVLP